MHAITRQDSPKRSPWVPLRERLFNSRSRLRDRWRAPFGYRHVLRVGLPLVAGMASETLMLFIDRLFLSHYSVSAIAAVLPAGCLAFAAQIAFMGICSYASVFTAQYMGAKQPEHIGAIFWQSIWLSLVFGLILGASGFFFADGVFAASGHQGHIATLESAYFRILLLGSFPLLLGNALSAFFIGLGRTKPVLFANLAGVAINISLDWLLIYGRCGLPEYGISGAALATVAGQVLSAVLLACLIFSGSERGKYSLWASWPVRAGLMARLLRFGGPSGFNMLVDMAGFSWFILQVGRLGETALAASNIVFSVNSLVFMPMMGLNSAVASLVGTAVGSGNVNNAKKAATSALHLSLAYMMPMSFSLALGGEWYIDMFMPADSLPLSAETRSTGIILLWYVAAYSLVDSCNIIYFGALKGAGDTVFVMLALCWLAVFGLGLPILLLEHFGMTTLHSLWIVFSLYVTALALTAWRRFSSGRWQGIRLVDKRE
ncbi:MAG: MATE family efflux transporter [Desulfovibrio sp.]|nr:MATE family efflux transporter [Desulfovibrio sp.]